MQTETAPIKDELDVQLEKQASELEVDPTPARPISKHAHYTARQVLSAYRKNIFICVLVLFITANDGYQLALPGSIIANTGFIRQFGTKVVNGKRALDAQHVAAWGGMYSAGYISSLLISSFPNDHLGRKAGMLVIGLTCMLATVVCTVAKGWGAWGAGKILNGIAIGFAQSTLTAYVSELAPIQIRGGLLGVYSIFFAIGQFTAAICLYVVQRVAPLDYKRAIYTEWIWSGLFVMIWLYIPESPAFYIRKGKIDKAFKVFSRINGGVPGIDLEHEFSVKKYEVEQAMAQAALNGKVNWTSIYRGTDLRRTYVSFFPLALQQLAGIPIVFGQTAIFFAAAGLANPFLGTVIVNIILLTFIGISFSIVDRLGRRPLYLVNGTIMITALFVVGAMGTLARTSAVSNVTIVMLCLWVAAYSTSFGPLGYVYLAESSSSALRAKTTGHAAAGTGLFGLIFNYCTPLMILPTGAGWGLKTAFFYGSCLSVGLVIFYFTIPETKGRSYNQLDELFVNKIPARKFKSTKTSFDTPATQE